MSAPQHTPMGMIKGALDRSYSFVRHLNRFSLKSDRMSGKGNYPRSNRLKVHFSRRQNKSKVKTHNESQKTFWVPFSLSFVILIISFSMISKPGEVFSKSRGVSLADFILFILTPVVVSLFLLCYSMYKFLINRNKLKSNIKRKDVKIHIRKT